MSSIALRISDLETNFLVGCIRTVLEDITSPPVSLFTDLDLFAIHRHIGRTIIKPAGENVSFVTACLKPLRFPSAMATGDAWGFRTRKRRTQCARLGF